MPPPLRAAAALGISYRPAAEEDVPFLTAVYGSTRQAELDQTGWPVEQKLGFIAHQYNAQKVDYDRNYPDAERLIVERGGDRIGRLYVEDQGTRVLLIDIALLPSCCGQGLGSAILADLIDQARAAAKPLVIHVETFNPARRLYERLGFTFVEEKGFYHMMEWRPDAETSSA